MVGGTCGIMGAIAAGPRVGRFDKNSKKNFKPHNVPLVVLGTLILWFGWFGFNAGSTLSMSGDGAQLASMVSVNTMIAASAGGLVTFMLRSTFRGKNKLYDITAMCNGILAGLVGVTAACGNVTNGSAVLIGGIGGVFYTLFSLLITKSEIDDPLDAFAVHCGAGIWGVLSVGLFDKTHGLFYGNNVN